MNAHEAETKILKVSAWLLKEKCHDFGVFCERCPFSVWKDGKDACVFGDTVPDDWPLELIEDRKTWPEDE